jgi:hypothetical protein
MLSRRRPRCAPLAKDSSKTTNDVGRLRSSVVTLADVVVQVEKHQMVRVDHELPVVRER